MLLSREKITPLVSELLGTFILTFVVLSVSKSAIGIPYFVAIAAGFVLSMAVVVVGKYSGAHINPAVTFGLWSAKKIGTLKAILYIAVQFMGAAFAWRLYTYLIDSTIPNIANTEFDWRIFTAEMVGALIFTFGLAAAIYQKLESGKLALTAGVSLTVGIIVASAASNGVINPAVALGIQSWSKAYVIAPLVGGLIGVNLYALLFAGANFEWVKPKSTKPVTKKVSASKRSTSKKPTNKTAKRKKK